MAYRPTGEANAPLRRSRSGAATGSRRRRAKKKHRILKRVLMISGIGCLSLILLGIVGFFIAYQTTEVPSANKIAVSQTSVITYKDGSQLGRIASENRESVKLEDVPKPVQHAVLAAENRDFYSEPGFSITGFFRAFWANVRGQDIQGGSTITQQLVKKTYLTDERTYTRKFKELILALKLERQLSKDEILEKYLNTVYYGRGAYGVQTASKAYFGKPVSELNTSEAAVLASVIRNPSLYNPETQQTNLQNRYQYVITGMDQKGWLPAGEKIPQKYPKVTEDKGKNQYRGQNGYLIEMVKQELARKGISDDQLHSGGYRVQTTFDPEMMRYAVKAVKRNFPDSLKEEGVDVGMASIDPKTGQVRAIYGGPGYLKEQLNHATSGGLTQPGSSFKPYVMATALKQGISLKTSFNGTSPQPVNGHLFRNDGNHNYGYVDMQTATQKSINTAYLNMGQEAGLENVVRNAKELGYETSPWCTPGKNATHIAPVTSLPLGPMDICPLAQAGGIATFANQGTFNQPTTIAKVTKAGSGRVIIDGKPESKKVFSKGVAADTLYGMSKIADPGGTGMAARLPDRPIAGKTGTSTENRSAWFVGTIPQLTTTVAIYRAEGGTIPGVAGEVQGGSIPAQIWQDYMSHADKNMEPEEFPDPEFVGTIKNDHPTGLPTKTKSESSTPTDTNSPTPTDEPTPTEPPETPSTPPPTQTGGPTPTQTNCNPITGCDRSERPRAGG